MQTDDREWNPGRADFWERFYDQEEGRLQKKELRNRKAREIVEHGSLMNHYEWFMGYPLYEDALQACLRNTWTVFSDNIAVRILHVGCGNSDFCDHAEALISDLRSVSSSSSRASEVLNIDINRNIIVHLSLQFPERLYAVGNCCDLHVTRSNTPSLTNDAPWYICDPDLGLRSVRQSSVDIVFDKGTADALLSSFAGEYNPNMEAYVGEILKVLRPGGVTFLISINSEDVLNPYFLSAEDNSKAFRLRYTSVIELGAQELQQLRVETLGSRYCCYGYVVVVSTSPEHPAPRTVCVMRDHEPNDSETDLPSSKVDEYVHPASARVLRAAPFVNHIPIFNITIRSFHPKLVFAICMQRMFEKGLASGLMRHSLQPMLTGRFNLQGKLYQRYASSYSTGWALSSLITVMGDTIAVCGYTKRWYCVFSALGGGLFAVLYGILPADDSSAKKASVFLIMTAFFMSNIDVFAVALYSEQIRRRPASGPALVSWMWGTALIGLMISSVIQGPLSDRNIPEVGAFLAGGIVFMSGLLFLFNLVQERRNKDARWADAQLELLQKSNTPDRAMRESLTLPENSFDTQQVASQVDDDDDDEEKSTACEQRFVPPQVKTYLGGVFEINQDIFLQNWRMAVFCLIVTLGVIEHSIVNIMGTTLSIMCSCITLSVVVCVSSYFTLPRTIANTAVFIYFNALLYLNLPGVLNTFYRASPSCVPGGPNFSYTFYNAMTGVVGNIASIAGTMIFTHMFPNRSYRFVMSLSAVLLPAASMFDLIILKRWNIAIGIPDHAMYVFGDAIIYEVCDMLLNMPTMMLMCRIAPRGAESIVFAILASIYHLGTSTSTAIGYLLMDTIWPVVTKGECDYSNAPWLVITGHIIAPVFICPLAYIFLPSARISDNIDHTGQKVTVAKTSEHCSEPTNEPAPTTKKMSD